MSVQVVPIGVRSALLLAFVSLALPRGVEAQQTLRSLLTDTVGLSEGDFENLRDGEIVSVLVDASESREMATFGGYVVNVPADELEQAFQDLPTLLAGNAVASGRLGTPPTLADVRELALASDDLDAAKECEPGRCDIKVSTTALARLRSDVRWGEGDELAQLNAVARVMVLEYGAAYLEGGNDALAVYHDKGNPQPIVDGNQALVRESASLRWLAPEMGGYLRTFPEGRPGSARDFLYWASEDFGLRPVTTLNHATVYAASEPLSSTVVTMKQLYATHYFQAVLRIVAMIEDPQTGGSGRTYVLHFARYLFDDDLGRINRRILRGRLRDHVRDGLEQQRLLLRRGSRGW